MDDIVNDSETWKGNGFILYIPLSRKEKLT